MLGTWSAARSAVRSVGAEVGPTVGPPEGPTVGPPVPPMVGVGLVTLPGGSSEAPIDGSAGPVVNTSGRSMADSVPVPKPVPIAGIVGVMASRSVPAHVGQVCWAASSMRTRVVTACTHSSCAVSGSLPSSPANEAIDEAVNERRLVTDFGSPSSAYDVSSRSEASVACSVKSLRVSEISAGRSSASC